jgi:hypothetical protein
LCCTDSSFDFVKFDGSNWSPDEEAWKEHVAAMANAGADAVRILPYAIWDAKPYGRKGQFCPWVLDEAADAWDLGRFNGHYYPIMRRIFEIANSYNLEVWAPWFDNCQLIGGSSKYSPWRHNVNGVITFYEEAADPFVIALIKKNLAEFSGLKMFWPWGNELNNVAVVDWAQRVIFKLLPSLGIPFNKMTYGATMSKAPYNGDGTFGQHFSKQDLIRAKFELVFGKDAKMAVVREVHGCGSSAFDKFSPFGLELLQAAWWWANKKVGDWLPSDDGVHDRDGKYGGRPGPETWYEMALWLMKNVKNLAGVEHCPETWSLALEVAVLEAISRAHKKAYGEWPKNYGKHHYEPPSPPVPPPPPEPPPPPPPPPPDEKGFWEKIWEWIKRLFR